MVVIFCTLILLALIAFVWTRISMKQQAVITFRQVRAHYMAQSGIQHALLKLRILPNESYDAAAVARGICMSLRGSTAPSGPFTPQPAFLTEFMSDINTNTYPINGAWAADFPNWRYETTTFRAVMANRESDTRTHAVEIEVEGSAEVGFKGVATTTTDIVKRTVKVERFR